MSTLSAVRLEDTAFGTLAAQHRLLNAVLKEPLPRAGTFGFRGDIALAFQDQVADEARPPAYSVEQVLAVADSATGKIPVLAGYLHNFAWLKDVGDVLGDVLVPEGTYVFFVNNIDFLKKYSVPLPGGVIARVLPLDESTVWKETLELVGIDKNDVKKMNGAGKLEYVLDALAGAKLEFPMLGYEDGVAIMEPVRNRNENRPV
ncbi:hypothetical protein [Novosphingobium album (ex Liu et al. 2023)]|uniref:Uncharacterized protein n=1 Tax=Novosphingobium album (ex Liu et al. 2023) TaxID=3031130 RepID=A0ABT5WS74_9SPHN|nr:hypothetical protein [Novosphingobium album (ex Liu et al. 2023)]MDE8652884.1 hypothetical protein [Novosphingobium album (ex Liu et al. 2023)]